MEKARFRKNLFRGLIVLGLLIIPLIAGALPPGGTLPDTSPGDQTSPVQPSPGDQTSPVQPSPGDQTSSVQPSTPSKVSSGSIPNWLGVSSFTGLILRIVDWLMKVGVAIAVIFIIYAGVLFVTSGGNDDKVKTAKMTLTWAIVGLIVILIGEGWIAIVENFLTG